MTLKPCPFCGSDNIAPLKLDPSVLHITNSLHVVKCNNCLAEGPPRIHVGSANQAWNHRAKDEIAQALESLLYFAKVADPDSEEPFDVIGFRRAILQAERNLR